jgi:hypothetical protein
MKQMLIFLIVGLALRLVLMPLTIHPDFRAYSYGAYLISQKGEYLTFYDHVSKLPRDNKLVEIYGDGWFIYPPLAYLSHALFMGILAPLYPWDTFQTLISDIGSATQLPGMPWLLFLSKLPYLVADGIILWILWKFTEIRNRAFTVVFWIFNPVTLYAAYMMGQFDIFIALFILIAVVLAEKRRSVWGAVALGVAAAFKPFPLVILPFFTKDKVRSVFAGLITYALLVSPYLTSIAFKHYALFASQSDKPFYAKIMVSGGQYISIFLLVWGILAWLNWLKPKMFSQVTWLAAPLLIFYSVTHFHPQWFVWVSPLLIIKVAKNRKLVLPYISMLILYGLIILSFDSSLNFGLFYHLNLTNILSPLFGDNNTSIIRSLFAATTAIFFLISNSSGEDK